MAQVIECVIDTCDWTHEVVYPDPRINESTLADIFGPGVFVATANARVTQDVEHAIAEHYRKHSIVELLQTCARRAVELGETRSTVAKMHRLMHPEVGDKVFGYAVTGARIEGVLVAASAMDDVMVEPGEAAIGFEHNGQQVRMIVFRDSVRGLE